MANIRDPEKMMIVIPSIESDGRNRCAMSIEAARANITNAPMVNQTRVYGIHDKLSSLFVCDKALTSTHCSFLSSLCDLGVIYDIIKLL